MTETGAKGDPGYKVSTNAPVAALRTWRWIVPLRLSQHADHIRVDGSGLYTLLESQEHFRDLSSVVSQCRKSGRQVRVLVDLREGAPQTPEVVAHIEKANQVIFRDGDRVSIIVTSALLKLQIKRLHSRFESQVFVSDIAAREYLFRVG